MYMCSAGLPLALQCVWFWFLCRSSALQGDQRGQHLRIPAASLGYLYRCTSPRGAEEDSRERRGNFISCHCYCLLTSVVVMPVCLGFAQEFCFWKAAHPLRCKNCVLVMTVWVFWYACSKKRGKNQLFWLHQYAVISVMRSSVEIIWP